MRTLTIFRTFKTLNFELIVDAVEDYDLDLSFDTTGEIARKIESGELTPFCARARLFYRGAELSSDYLGGCIYESPAAFMDHKEAAMQARELRAAGSDTMVGSYFADMVRTVILEARVFIAGTQSCKMRVKI